MRRLDRDFAVIHKPTLGILFQTNSFDRALKFKDECGVEAYIVRDRDEDDDAVYTASDRERFHSDM